MMRKGDLAQFPVDWVLRQASEEGLSGGIEFDASPSACVYLSDGDVYHAVRDGRDPDDGGELDEGTEERLRGEALEVIRSLLAVAEGWYYFHDLNHHPLRGAWQWSTERLLAEAETAIAEEVAASDPLLPWASTAVSLGARPTTPPGDDAWEVLGALMGRRDVAPLATGLGWERERVAAALDELARTGVLVRHEVEVASGPVAAPITSAMPVHARRDLPPPAAPPSSLIPPRAESRAARRSHLVAVPPPPPDR